VDNAAAARFQRFDGHFSERVMRDAVEKTFRSAARGAQGVFAVHQHGGTDRLAHPHVHALLSPRFANRMPAYISPVRIQRIKEAWEMEVLRGLERQERRLARTREALASTPPPRARDRGERPGLHLLPSIVAPRREGQLEQPAKARRSLQLARDNGLAREWLRFGKRGHRWEQDPEKAARQAVFRLASRAMPKPTRDVLWLLRGLRDVDLRRRFASGERCLP
jgi:hypothetical protein